MMSNAFLEFSNLPLSNIISRLNANFFYSQLTSAQWYVTRLLSATLVLARIQARH